MNDVFRLRYRVYCEEKNFLPADDYPCAMEMDEYDDDAIHLVVRGGHPSPVGYMRILESSTTEGFPLIAHGLTTYSDFPIPPEDCAVEISRLIVTSELRHHSVDPDDGFKKAGALPAPPARNAADLVTYKLMRMAYRYAADHDVRWILAAMEPSLHRKFRMMGLPFRQVGPTGSYFGRVAPYAMDIREMERDMRSRFQGTWRFFESGAEDVDSTTIYPGQWSRPIYPAAVRHLEGFK